MRDEATTPLPAHVRWMLDAAARIYASNEAALQRLLYGSNVFEVTGDTVRLVPHEEWPPPSSFSSTEVPPQE